jgi:hypothetical protein
MTNPENDQKLEDLISVGTRLLGQIEAFTSEGGRQFVNLAQRAQSNRRAIWLLSISLLLDVALTVFMIFSQIQISSNEHGISSLTDRLDTAQTTQRQKALCPLYQLLLDSKSDAGRATAPDKKAYDHAFSVIQVGYDALDCSVFINSNGGPPASSSAATPTAPSPTS